MKKSEAALILAAAAARDLRRVGEADVLAWHEDLEDVTYPEAREALKRYYRDHTERVMPAHIRQFVRIIRDEQRRKSAHEVRALPSRFEDDNVRDKRVARGAELCREVLAAALKPKPEEEPQELTPSDEIRLRALERARSERKNSRIASGTSSVGDVLAQIMRRSA